MAKKTYYNFDQETLTYQPKPIHNKKQVLQNLLVSLVCGFVLCLVGLVSFALSYGNIEEVFHKEIQKHIINKLQKQDSKLEKIEVALNKLHENDQTFYRSILNKTPVDKSVWEAGIGGNIESNDYIPPIAKMMSVHRNKILYKFNIQKHSFNETHQLASKISAELAHVPAIRPIHGRIVSGFGYRADPFHGHGHFHAGLDIVAAIGTPIKAVADGTIITSGAPEQGYGLQVEVNHGFGYVTKYAHLSQLCKNIGQVVKRGEVIGYTGNTGYSTGPHLHYEVIKNGEKVNPMNYIYGE